MEDAVFVAGTTRPVGALADEIAEFAGHLNTADRRCRALLAEFDRRAGWAGAGALVIHGRLPAEVGALFVKSIDAIMQRRNEEERAAMSELREPFLRHSVRFPH
jgi:hypothetical protein